MKLAVKRKLTQPELERVHGGPPQRELRPDERLETPPKPPMRVEEAHVRPLAPAPLRAEDADELAALRGAPRLEAHDEGRDERQPSERASLGRRPRGRARDAERRLDPGRRLPHGGQPVAAELARDEARDEPGDVRCAEACLGLPM